MGITKLIYDRTRLASKEGRSYYKVIYDEVGSGESNKSKTINAKSLNEADAKFHEMELDPNIKVVKKIKLMSKLVYKTRSASKSFSKTGDLFIAIGEALESNNPKSELDKLAKKYGFKREDFKQAVESYIRFDDKLSQNAGTILKQAGFSEDTKEFTNKYPSIDFNKLARDTIIEQISQVLVQLFENYPNYVWEGSNYLILQLNYYLKNNPKAHKEWKDAIKYTIDKIK